MTFRLVAGAGDGFARESISFSGRTHELHGSKEQDKSTDRESNVSAIFQTCGEPAMRDNIPVFKGILLLTTVEYTAAHEHLVCGRTTLRLAQS
jgi:hypothetical protein